MCAARDPGPLSLLKVRGGAFVSNQAPSSRRNLDTFLERTDPLVLSAMRKTSQGNGPLTIEEHAALDAFLEPRLAALVDLLMDGLVRGRR